MIAFGPVPSRRLGQSLGINNIPPKNCTYSCVYCQLGRTYNIQNERKTFYKPEEIFSIVQKRIEKAREKDEVIDYLTFVPDGEPTLDVNLSREIGLLNPLGIKIAVITNSSLIWKKEVRDDLSKADWVSVKIDAISQDIWEKINRPHKSLKLQKILAGISDFSRSFTGDLTTETMLIKGINDTSTEIEKITDFISNVYSKRSYISIPSRPPTEKWVKSATEYTINKAYQIFKKKGIDVEYLIGYEGNAFAFTGDIENDLLGIMSVHPMREDGISELLSKANTDWSIMEKLMRQGTVVTVQYNGAKYYMRSLSKEGVKIR